MLESIFQRHWLAIAMVWLSVASVSKVVELILFAFLPHSLLNLNTGFIPDWKKPIKMWHQKLWRFGRVHWPVHNAYHIITSAYKFGVEANGKKITPYYRTDSAWLCRMWTHGIWIVVSVVGVRLVRAHVRRTQRGSMHTGIGHGKRCTWNRSKWNKWEYNRICINC